MIRMWLAKLFNLDLIAIPYAGSYEMRFPQQAEDGTLFVRVYGETHAIGKHRYGLPVHWLHRKKEKMTPKNRTQSYTVTKRAVEALEEMSRSSWYGERTRRRALEVLAEIKATGWEPDAALQQGDT